MGKSVCNRLGPLMKYFVQCIQFITNLQTRLLALGTLIRYVNVRAKEANRGDLSVSPVFESDFHEFYRKTEWGHASPEF